MSDFDDWFDSQGFGDTPSVFVAEAAWDHQEKRIQQLEADLKAVKDILKECLRRLEDE